MKYYVLIIGVFLITVLFALIACDGGILGSGSDSLGNIPDSSAEDDTISGQTEDNTIYGQEGDDTIYGQAGDDTIYGQAGNDTIYGQAGNDTIYGQEGDDTIDPGAGDDVVDGGLGYDTLIVTGEIGLDFSNVTNIESIDLNENSVDQTLTLSLDQVLNMTDENNTLQFTGETGDSVTLTGVIGGEWTHDSNGLFTNVADNSIQITIAPVNDGVDIDVDDDNGDSFWV